MTGDGHVPFRGSLGVKLPGATRLRVRCLDGQGVPGGPVRTVLRTTWWSTAAPRPKRTRCGGYRGRLAECGGLQLHPDKTRIVYCKDGKRRGSYEHTSFTFLGYGFRVRKVRTKTGKYFFSFNPAMSDEAAKRIRGQIRSWRLHLRSGMTLEQLAREINPVVRGWIKLRTVLSVRIGFQPQPHQRLFGAVARTEVQAVPRTMDEGARRPGQPRQAVSRTLARLEIRQTVTEDDRTMGAV